MNTNALKKLTYISIFICLYNTAESISPTIDDHIFPKSLTFLNDTQEEILISHPTHQKISPGQSFLLSDDTSKNKTPYIRWHILKNVNSGIHISSGVFTLKGNILTIVEIYDENPQGSKAILKPFKKTITLSSTSENFTLWKNSRLIDIEQKN